MEHLKRIVGFENEWTGDQLLRAIDELELVRDAFKNFMAAWTERRCTLKGKGFRTPTTEEREELRSRPWLTWPIPVTPNLAQPLRPFDPMPFRERQRSDYVELRAALAETEIEGVPSFEVRVYDDVLSIPYRLYIPEVSADVVASLSATQQMMFHCLFTRHHDGFVRQRHLVSLLGAEDPWVVPYVVALIGEYVVEILHDIERRIEDIVEAESNRRRMYGRFAADNTRFIQQTKNRVASFWSEYHSFMY